MHDDEALRERRRFLGLATVFEGAILLLALAIGQYWGQPSWQTIRVSCWSIGAGLLATVPLLAALALTYFTRIRPLQELRELTERLIGPSLGTCKWLDLIWVALLAGVSEEFLFRGTIEPALVRWGPVTAVIVTNLLFGLCHALNTTYFLFAAIVGVYLSLTMHWSDEPNLLVPIVSHGCYDFVAFAVIQTSWRRRKLQTSPVEVDPAEKQISPDPPVFPVSQ